MCFTSMIHIVFNIQKLYDISIIVYQLPLKHSYTHVYIVMIWKGNLKYFLIHRVMLSNFSMFLFTGILKACYNKYYKIYIEKQSICNIKKTRIYSIIRLIHK